MQAPSRDTVALAGSGVNIEDAISSFARRLRVNDKKPRTIQVYSESVGQLARFLRERGMPATADGFTGEHVGEYLLNLRERGMKPSTVSVRYRALRTFSKWLVKEGERKDDPMQNIEPPRLTELQPRVLTLDELKRLVETTAKDKSLAGRRDLSLIYLFIDTGARRSEIAGLRKAYQWLDEKDRPVGPARSDLDLEQPAGALLTLWGKGDRERIVRIGDKAADALESYLRKRGESRPVQELVRDPKRGSYIVYDWLWVNARRKRLTDSGIFQAIRKRGEVAGIDGIYLHAFRHSEAHDWLVSGGSEGDLMARMGWTSTAMIRRYASTTRQERAHAAHERFGLGDKL